MDDKQLDLRTRIAQAIVPLCELLEEIVGTAPQAAVGPPKDIDYDELAEAVNAEFVAGYMDEENVASYISTSDVAEYVDCDAVAMCLEIGAVASAIDMDDLSGYLDLQGYVPDTEEFVSEAMSNEFYVEAIAKAVAAEFIKRLTPKVEPATTNPDGQAPVSPDGQEPVNLSPSPDGTPVNNNNN